ncbi:TIGR02450 family Trp-rich protein [Dasania sp. GY-MA-18]|uniref:TIGR02450 family Trp-rich protein n=1 Tax=Dasania phycosphaerae TaxID=2950436 RepID=A0A9J6RLM7_9GAMM|nr:MULTISPECIES: TIGR02450 family Trp-rich protein [Dasania]MCR8922795.1 TIGR02450 family Trp-rich protein [Dasania sp. GY-MA-18]MCZ0865225.1 TIGR02450 family Trp-rich protein [Dasania phycosphaerae]MCZ0868951.1 TIGR02450 family Trp-rich protein [Dasania phycosphaerae]
MNTINPKKLLNSKWTAVTPKNQEKHFIVTKVEYDEDGIVILCLIESVMSKQPYPINWQDLKNDNVWLHGWQ